ncbi:hypothetical protein [Noviherbaspirillum galbum]|uniref:Uncharacterized protein n=1 Tax=Noviherbaspirillum galbum TaxID=2709383 RepID=A0A6B3SGT0_9BURK|nr:hypothetical protein [Noviherbaspirillum galbum]NEX60061.1 hypothetical protein [Noviherbaspirillum galbum]
MVKIRASLVCCVARICNRNLRCGVRTAELGAVSHQQYGSVLVSMHPKLRVGQPGLTR